MHASTSKSDFTALNPNSKKCIRVVLIGLICLICSGIKQSHAQDLIDYHGFRTFYGKSNWTDIGPSDQRGSYEWYNLSYLAGKRIHPYLFLETTLGPGQIEDDATGNSASVEWRFLINLQGKYLYLRAGTGICYLFDSQYIQDLSDSNFFAIISCSIGFEYHFQGSGFKGTRLAVGYSVEHLSDPFRGGEDGDNGVNAGVLTVSLSWIF